MAYLGDSGLSKVWTRMKSYINERVEYLDTTTDWVVEQTTSGMWTYRKWNSGIAECWGTLTITSALNSAWGNVYVSNSTTVTAYPFTFIERPKEIVSVQTITSTAWVVRDADGKNTTSQTGKYRATRSGSDTASKQIDFDFYVIGRWK